MFWITYHTCIICESGDRKQYLKTCFCPESLFGQTPPPFFLLSRSFLSPFLRFLEIGPKPICMYARTHTYEEKARGERVYAYRVVFRISVSALSLALEANPQNRCPKPKHAIFSKSLKNAKKSWLQK